MADYDGINLAIDPDDVASTVTTLEALCSDMSDQLVNIENTIFNLQLSWVGSTEAEAQEFVDQWNSVMTDLFGTTDNPEEGVLPVILDGLQGAAVAFSNVETQIELAFENFEVGLEMSAVSTAATPTSTPSSEPTNSNDSAVSETFPG